MSTNKEQAYFEIFQKALYYNKSMQITLRDSPGGLDAAAFLAECCRRKIVCSPATAGHLRFARQYDVWEDIKHRKFSFSVLVGKLTAAELAEGLGLDNIEALKLDK